MSSSSKDSSKTEKRIDLLFSKFAAFYGHVWRSQLKDKKFLKFAKSEWQEGLSEFTDTVLGPVDNSEVYVPRLVRGIQNDLTLCNSVVH